MSSPMHLSPLLINEKTNEPYLRLPPPHSNIIITPPRLRDAEAIVEILNDRRVFYWLQSTPYPYSLEHAKQWLESTSKEADMLIQQLKEVQGDMIGGCPVRILREVKENGDEVFLGDCRISKWDFDEILDPGERARVTAENEQRPPGDPKTVWAIGDFLAASHHGRGIMTLAIGTLIEAWVRPRMGAREICANVFQGNHGSVRVFEKNGFVLETTLKEAKAISESKGGGLASIHVMRCRFPSA